MRGDRAQIGRGAAPASDLRVTGTPDAIARLFLDTLPDVATQPVVSVDGDEDLLGTLVGAFNRGDDEPDERRLVRAG